MDDLAGENEGEDSPLITPVQQKLLSRVVRDLCAYFGIYYISQQLDQVFDLKDDSLAKLHKSTEFIAGIVFI